MFHKEAVSGRFHWTRVLGGICMVLGASGGGQTGVWSTS